MEDVTANLRRILKAGADVAKDIEESPSDPTVVREAVKKTASTLIECYGEEAPARAKANEASARDSLFAKMVTAEVEKLRGGR